MNNAQEARRMLRAHRYGALSTLSKKFDGYPFGSITPYLVDHDGSLLILISELAEHTKNIQHDPRVSLITHDQRDPHIQTQGRVSALGNAALAADQEQAALRYLRYFPESRITDRGKPVARLVPISRTKAAVESLTRMEKQGLIKLGSGKLPRSFWAIPRPEDPQGLVLKALLEEREED